VLSLLFLIKADKKLLTNTRHPKKEKGSNINYGDIRLNMRKKFRFGESKT
jgi:hypothetical protein